MEYTYCLRKTTFGMNRPLVTEFVAMHVHLFRLLSFNQCTFPLTTLAHNRISIE
jgi:hypothetical protein